MCGLGHYLEDEGIASVAISLVREHSEAMRPPRALWVPFDLGRPLGPPSDAAFQREVLAAALGLLEAPRGPVLEDFPKDAPGEGGAAPWACPLPLPTPERAPDASLGLRFREEWGRLEPWYQAAARERGTTAGASGLEWDAIAAFLADCIDAPGGRTAVPASATLPFAEIVKLAVEDLKTAYLEAAAAQPARRRATARELADWFWGDTVAGQVMVALKKRYESSDDEALQLLGRVLFVPIDQRHRL